MPQSLGRWYFTDKPGVPCTPIDATARRVFADAAAPAAAKPAAEHVHVWLDGAGPAPRRRSARDRNGGQVLARLSQDGGSGKWRAFNPDGRELMMRQAEDGRLEIMHYPDGATPPGAPGHDPLGRAVAGNEVEDEYDPDEGGDRIELQNPNPAAVEGQWPAAGQSPAPAQDARRRIGDEYLRRPDRHAPGDEVEGLRSWQRAINAHYGQR